MFVIIYLMWPVHKIFHTNKEMEYGNLYKIPAELVTFLYD